MAQLAAEATLGLDLREINFLDDHDAIADVSAGPAILAKVEPADPLQIQYTSGTTGFPKGAVIHHKGLFNNGRFVADRARVSHDSVIANFMPLFHTAGCGMNGMAALANASTQVLFRGFNADHVCKAIEQHRITTFFAVPTMLVALLESLQHTHTRHVVDGADHVRGSSSCARPSACGARGDGLRVRYRIRPDGALAGDLPELARRRTR